MSFSEMLDIDLQVNSRRAFVRGDVLKLRNKEFELMSYFIANAGKVVTRTDILQDVWDRNIFCSTNTVDVHVSNLRRKLKKMNAENLITTIHCVGYIFESNVPKMKF